MRPLPKTIALLTSAAVLVALAWPGVAAWNALALATSLAIPGLGLLYPWALAGPHADSAAAARRDLQEIDVGPASGAFLF